MYMGRRSREDPRQLDLSDQSPRVREAEGEDHDKGPDNLDEIARLGLKEGEISVSRGETKKMRARNLKLARETIEKLKARDQEYENERRKQKEADRNLGRE